MIVPATCSVGRPLLGGRYLLWRSLAPRPRPLQTPWVSRTFFLDTSGLGETGSAELLEPGVETLRDLGRRQLPKC